jgi:anaerobic selenocysteine-containing dehydrogenase
MIVNLLLLRGNIGKPGAGACPVRGHSNVQGDRTMGINEKPAAAFLDKLGAIAVMLDGLAKGVLWHGRQLRHRHAGHRAHPSGAAPLPASRTRWLWLIEDYDRIRDKIAEVVDGFADFADFNARVHVPGGFYLGNAAREQRRRTAGAKARLIAHPLPDRRRFETKHGDSPLFNLMTVRSQQVQHHRLRHRRPLPRRVRPSERVLHQPARSRTPRHGGRPVGRHDLVVGRWRAGGAPLPAGRVRHPRGLLRQLLPRDQRAGATKQRRPQGTHPGVEVDSSATESERGDRRRQIKKGYV